jgi:hypothetical protein
MRIREVLREDSIIVDSSYIHNLAKSIHHTYNDLGEGDLTDRIYWFNQYKLVDLPISNIKLSEWDLDDDRVTQHMEKIVKSRHTMPPIIFDPIRKSIIDGTHRANAYYNLGYKTIPAYVGTIKSDSYGEHSSDY